MPQTKKNPSQKKFHFFAVDDDEDLLEMYRVLLEGEGHKVTTTTSSSDALDKIIELQPDCVISDLALPEIGGFDLFKRVRNETSIKQPSFIIITSRQYGFDSTYATKLGVNGYIQKPINPETFVSDILEILVTKMLVQFWGVRGTLPVPGKMTSRYGGNTNCITLAIGHKHFFIFDAGTGIKALSNFLLLEKKSPLAAKLFLSHPHWDHINGLPFFVPFYMKNNVFDIYGTNHSGVNLEGTVSAQMDSVYFPVTTREFAAHMEYHPINEEEFFIDDIKVRTIFLVHPGRCLGYRIDCKERSFCYITDNELYPENSKYYNKYDFKRLVDFIYETDLLVTDSTYTDEEYQAKENWGHSAISQVVNLAHKAKVKLLCLHHHDPDQTDRDIDNKLAFAKAKLKELHSKTRVVAPYEGSSIEI